MMFKKFTILNIALSLFLPGILHAQTICTSSRRIIYTDQITNYAIFHLQEEYVFPTAFSPDGNGVFDVFTVYTTGGFTPQIKLMRIFDRWNSPIFERRNFQANDTTKGWDGTFQGKPVAMDMFSYYVEIVLKDGTILEKAGEVMVLR